MRAGRFQKITGDGGEASMERGSARSPSGSTIGGEPIPLEEIRAASDRIAGVAMRTPLVPLEFENAPARIFLKLENLQPIGSFKIRGACNAIATAPRDEIARGVWTASAGNMAQGVAWEARRLGIPCAVVAPDHAPETKLAAVKRLGATITTVPFAEWFEILETRVYPGMDGYFVHPVCDRAVMAGNGTIGLEILEDLPEVDAVVVPFGGGGLSCGIASAIRALRPEARVFASEVATAAPLSASFAVGGPARIDYRASFVDGVGSPAVLDDMWPLARRLLAGSLVSSLDQIAAAVRLLIERTRVVAEGAGASTVAAALAGKAGHGTVACVVSGGNIDSAKIAKILSGGVP
jgi:threonine dehydratase